MESKARKFISYYRPYKKTFFLDIFFSIVSACITITIPIILRFIINVAINFEYEKALKSIIISTVIVSILFFALYACNRYIKYHGRLMGSEIERDMREELFVHYQNLSLDFYNNQKIGKLMSRITTDLHNIGNFSHTAPEEIVDFTIKVIGALLVIFFTNIIMGIISFLVLLAIVLYSLNFIPKINNAVVQSHEQISNLNSNLEENLSGMQVVQSFTNEALEIKKFKASNEEFIKSKKAVYKITSVFDSGTSAFVITLIPIITMVSSFFVLFGKLSISDVVTFMLYIDILVGPIFSIFNLMEYFQESIAGYRRFTEILEIEPDIKNSKDAINIKKLSKNISFKNVTFGYNGCRNIINNLNLEIKEGEYVALVGQSGVGKTTLCNLIPRFYDPLNGKIEIGGIDIKNILLENLRDNIGFVPQDTYLFSGSIFENIQYGKNNATKEEVIKACEDAYLDKFINQLEDGYGTQVGQRGIKLSGGQKQRIAIARVFLKNPPILIFDEATSSLDNESEEYIRKSLEKLAKDRTTIVIAHRLSTIKNAKRILVLNEEGIVEDGTHEDLISFNGIYKGLYDFM